MVHDHGMEAPILNELFLQAENKFKCPCHGSQYNAQGKVVRGPAPLVRP
jgi:Rieske Fe-S protein